MGFITTLQDFIGKGLSFPLALTNGKALPSTGWDLIRSSIHNILAFKLGTRFFLGEFGARIEEMIEEPNDELLQNVITTLINDAILEWEKRVEVIGIELETITDSQLNINLFIRIKHTHDTENFIWPFYRTLS